MLRKACWSLTVLLVLLMNALAPCAAKLMPTSLENLVSQSDVILVGSVRVAHLGSADGGAVHGGWAMVKPTQVILGPNMSQSIKVTWEAEVHAQPLTTVDEEWLLFLKCPKERSCSPAHYGMSYFPIRTVGTFPGAFRSESETVKITPLRYPFTYVTKLKQYGVVEPLIWVGKDDLDGPILVRGEAILLERLVKAIHTIGKKRKALP